MIVGNVIQPAARFVLAVGFLHIGFGVPGVVADHVTAAGLAAIVGAWFFRRNSHPDRTVSPSKRPLRADARFALLQGGSSLLGVQTLGLSVLVLGVLGTDREVGLMGIALALQTPKTIVLGGVVNIWAPMVNDLYERREERKQQPEPTRERSPDDRFTKPSRCRDDRRARPRALWTTGARPESSMARGLGSSRRCGGGIGLMTLHLAGDRDTTRLPEADLKPAAHTILNFPVPRLVHTSGRG